MILYESDTCVFENFFSGFDLTLMNVDSTLAISCLSIGRCSFRFFSSTSVHSPIITEDIDFLNDRIDFSLFNHCVPVHQLNSIYTFFKDFKIAHVFETIFFSDFEK